MRSRTLALAALALAPIAAVASADVVYDEAVDGDLSDDPNAPTAISFLSPGTSTVIFTTDGLGDDRDIFTFNVAEGYQLSGIILDLFATEPAANLGFMGFAAGDVLGTDPLAPDPTALLGYALPGASDSGTDFFTQMGQAAGAQGYDGPLCVRTFDRNGWQSGTRRGVTAPANVSLPADGAAFAVIAPDDHCDNAS